MGKPIISSWTAVNPTIQSGGAPAVTVNFTPAADNKPLWFRFDLKQGSDSWLESDWIPVPNKNAGAVTLTYKRNGVQGIPSDWGGSKQVNLDAKLMWGEEGRGRGGQLSVRTSMFTIAGTAGDTSTPVIVSLTPVSQFIPVGGPAEATVIYNSGIDCYLKLDLRGEGGIAGWTENKNPGYQHAPAGQNKSIRLTFNNVPANWKPSEGIQQIAAQIVWSSSGSGRGGLLYRDTPIWTILEEDEEVVDDSGNVIIPAKTRDDGTNYTKQKTNTGDDDTTIFEHDDGGVEKDDTNGINGIAQWLKDNWIIVALIGGILLLVVPGHEKHD